MPRTTSRPKWADKYRGAVRRRLGRPARTRPSRSRGARCDPARTAELTARSRRHPGLGRDAGRAEAVLARQMEIYAGFLEHTDHHVGRLLDSLEDLEDPRRHPRLRRHRRQRRLGRRHPQGHFNELIVLRRLRRVRVDGVPGPRRSTSSAGRRPTTTTRSAGRMRWTRRTSGRSRSPRTGAGPGTARSSAGRTASRPRANSARSSTT